MGGVEGIYQSSSGPDGTRLSDRIRRTSGASDHRSKRGRYFRVRVVADQRYSRFCWKIWAWGFLFIVVVIVFYLQFTSPFELMLMRSSALWGMEIAALREATVGEAWISGGGWWMSGSDIFLFRSFRAWALLCVSIQATLVFFVLVETLCKLE